MNEVTIHLIVVCAILALVLMAAGRLFREMVEGIWQDIQAAWRWIRAWWRERR